MNDTNRSHPVSDTIDRYRQELLALYQQRTETTAPMSQLPRNEPPAASPLPENNWLDERYPLPDFRQDRAALTAQTETNDASPDQTSAEVSPTTDAPTAPDVLSTPDAPPAEEVPTFPYTDEDLNGEVPFPQEPTAPPAIGESPFVGYLRVFVFSGNGAEPLPQARVTVSRREGDGEVLYASAETNRDGFTPVLPLPSVNPELTMRPDVKEPFVAYDILVSADGFSSALHENVPVYGNNYVTQPVSMVPLLPGEDSSVVRQYRSNGPANL